MSASGDNGKNVLKQYHNIKVLMYHMIVEDDEQFGFHWTNVSKEQFRKHPILLDKWGFTPITFRDYILFTKGQLQLPRKPVILTFDDGYEEVYTIAFNMLKDMGWNAVVFVIGDQKIKMDLWNNRIGNRNPNLLNPEQIKEMQSAGFEIGSHSMSYLYLPNETQRSAWYEIAKSKEELESLLGSDVHSFCYPYGAVNEQLKQMVKDAGYEIGCGVYTGPPRFGHDIFDVRRITIPYGTDTFKFAIKLLTPFEYYEYVGSKVLHRNNDSYPADGLEFLSEKATKEKQTEPA
ncbi:MAG: polysaccharide deacetylase family protein [Bacteroidota bacterium]